MKASYLSFVVCVLAVSVTAADAPALDAQKYPQDTAPNALKSIIASLEAKDFSYWISHLILPEDSKRIIAKYDGLDKAAAKNADPAMTEKRQMQIEALKKIAAGKTSEGEKNGVKFFRFIDEGRVAQFEQQADKRWCMNVKVSNEKNMDNPGAGKTGKAEAPAKAPEEPKK